jgi:hypothetical protein
MNILQLTNSPSRIVVDYALPNLPEEVKAAVAAPEYCFYVMGFLEANTMYDFSAQQLYKKKKDGIEATYHTGIIFFGDTFYLEGAKDLNLIYRAVFHKGVLEEIELHSAEWYDNSERKRTMKKVIARIENKGKLEKNCLYRWLYVPYKVCADVVLKLVRTLLFLIFSWIDYGFLWLHNLLTPL